jgi:hypothetical protein
MPATVPSGPNRHPSPSEERIQAFYKWEWPRIRYRAIKRFKKPGWRCGACNHRQDDGARMVIDHIKPVRHHWELRRNQSNLQPLCNQCNLGKGSWDETDFRILDTFVAQPKNSPEATAIMTGKASSRLVASFRKKISSEIGSFVRDMMFRGRKKAPGEDE